PRHRGFHPGRARRGARDPAARRCQHRGVLLDLQLPGGPGRNLLRQLAHQAGRCRPLARGAGTGDLRDAVADPGPGRLARRQGTRRRRRRPGAARRVDGALHRRGQARRRQAARPGGSLPSQQRRRRAPRPSARRPVVQGAGTVRRCHGQLPVRSEEDRAEPRELRQPPEGGRVEGGAGALPLGAGRRTRRKTENFMTNPLFDGLLGRHAGSRRPFLYLADGAVVTYDEFLATTARFASALTELGLVPGDRLAMQVPKSPEALALYAACVQAGVVFLPLNTAYTPSEVDYFVGDAGASVLVGEPAAAGALAPIADTHGARFVTLDGGGRGTLRDIVEARSPEFDTVERSPDDL